ncbi:hypothetical protein LCGC14_0595840 [marine sediment metagenome]|uniref:Uncharacterized protein n=1 Tax=marine sediment metagenome TaxID=412755 RepID=A0A0F9RC00_9ZZZZ
MTEKCCICGKQAEYAVYHTITDQPKATYYCSEHFKERYGNGRSLGDPAEERRKYYKRLRR